MKNPKPHTIKAIFTNLLFVIGVILMIIGFVQASAALVKTLAFAKYPLASYEESRCDYEAITPVIAGENMAPTKPENTEGRVAKCETERERDRKVKQVEDFTYSLTLLLSGAVLMFSFKRFIFEKA